MATITAAPTGWGDEAYGSTARAAGPASPIAPGKVPAPTETGPDADGIITRTEYRENPLTKRVEKVTRRYRRDVRVVRIPAVLEERAKWAKFGAAGISNEGTAMVSIDELHFEKPGEAEAPGAGDLDKLKEAGKGIVRCRHCGEMGHYTLQCPYRDMDVAGIKGGGEGGGGPGEGGLSSAMEGRTGGAYVPPALRGGGGGAGMGGGGGEGSDYMPPEELRRIRIRNLEEDTTEEEVRAIVAPFNTRGFLRVSILPPREAGRLASAFVQFETHEEAEMAIKYLNGSGYKYMRLEVEWAKPSAGAGMSGSAGLSGMKTSGYGKALPQTAAAMRK